MQIKKMCDPNFKRGIHLDFHTPELNGKTALINFSGEQWAREMKKAHVQWATIFAKCHFGNSYYFTNIGHRHKDLDCDMLKEACDALHKQEISVSAYYSLAWDKYAGIVKPDWQERKIDGSLAYDKSAWKFLCVNSPYMDEFVLPQIREICQYDIDGLFIDIALFKLDTCFCKYCQDKYCSEYDSKLIIDDQVADPAKQKKFHADSMMRAMRSITKTVKSLLPDCDVVMNASHEIGQYLPLLDENIVDVTMIEAQGGSPHGGYNTIATQCRYARTLGKPFQIVNVRFHQGWGAMTMKSVEQMKYEFALVAMHGGQVICGDQGAWDGSLYSSVYDKIGEVFEFLKKRHDMFVGYESIKFAALLYGEDSPFPYSTEFPQPLMGGAKALTELHEQFDIINIEHLSTVGKYKLLLIPSGTKLSEKQAEQIREYVKNGGNVYLEYDAGINDESYQIIDELSACTFEGHADFNCSYVEDSETADFPLLITEPMMLIRNNGAEVFRTAYQPITKHDPPHNAFRHNYPTPEFNEKFTGITMNQPFASGGKVIRSAFPLFKVYWNENFYWIKKVLDEILDAFKLERPFKVDAPSTIEFNLTERDGVKILHCINFHTVKASTSPYSCIEYVPPVDIKLKLQLPEKPESLILQPDGTKIDFIYENGVLKFEITLSNVHCAIEIR